ncbi:MAG: GAF domain-containing protein [Chloroflexi bacterium]|nr:GAF domain-containing protein [Chloroflexota bacterium]
MKRLCTLLLLLLLLLSQAGWTQTQHPTRPLRACVYENAPKIYTAADGSASGFWPELMRHIADREGWQIVWVHGTWDECLQKLSTAEIDILPDTAWTLSRSQKYAFSDETVLLSWSRLYAAKGTQIESILDLEGKTIAGLAGSFNMTGPEGIEDLATQFGLHSTFVEMGSYDQVFAALEKGEVDAGVTNKDFGNLNEEKYDVVRTPVVFQPAQLMFAFPKESPLTPALLRHINAEMKALKADHSSVYYQVLDEYLGAAEASTEAVVLPDWVKPLLLALAVMALFLLAVWLVSLVEVRRRTRELRDSEERYRSLFENSPVALWEEGYSKLMEYVNTLVASGVKDLRTYLATHPEALRECLRRVHVVNVNQAALDMLQAKDKPELLGSLYRICTEDSFRIFQEEILVLAAGGDRFEAETQVKTLKGEVRDIYLRFVRQKGTGNATKPCLVLVATLDITDLKQAEHEMKRSQERLEVLHQLDGAILEAHSVADISHATLVRLDKLIPSSRTSIAVFDEVTGEAIVYARGVLKDDFGGASRVPIKSAFIDVEGLRAGRVVRLDDLAARGEYEGMTARLQQVGVRSTFSIPIRFQSVLLGSLNLAFDHPHGFSDEDIEVGQEVADSIAIALEQARLHEALESHASALENGLQELQQIHHLSLRLGNMQDASHVADTTLNVIHDALQSDVALFYLREGEQLNLLANRSNGIPFAVSKAKRHHEGRCLCGLAAQSGKPVFSLDILQDQRCTLQECMDAGIRSFAGLPLLAGKQVIGVIGLGSVSRRDFAASRSFLETLANEAAVGLQNALLLADLRRHEAELEQRVAARTAELVQANRELESFSYSVSHDLRAPLRAIDGFSRILADEYVDQLDDEANRLIDVVLSNTQHMGQLIDDLLAFSRVGRKAITPSQIDLADLARMIFDDLTDEAQRAKIRFSVQELPPAWGDASLIRQVFINLLTNAIKFSSVKETPTIQVGYAIEDGEIVTFVKDNGVGFEMQYAHKLFEIFQRLHSQEEFEGTGVGLSIVQRIITRHGGRVWAEAELGQGATFYFTLPSAAQ